MPQVGAGECVPPPLFESDLKCESQALRAQRPCGASRAGGALAPAAALAPAFLTTRLTAPRPPPQIVSSAIANAPPPDGLVSALHLLGRAGFTNKQTRNKMCKLFDADGERGVAGTAGAGGQVWGALVSGRAPRPLPCSRRRASLHHRSPPTSLLHCTHPSPRS
jgi:hypothetical protein